MMKKLLIVSLLVLFAINSQAQDITQTEKKLKRHEITVGSGFAGTALMYNSTTFSYSSSAVEGYHWSYHTEDDLFSHFASYKYWLNERMALGVSFLYDFTRIGLEKAEDHISIYGHGCFYEEYIRIFPTLAAELTFKYVCHPTWELYALFGLGVTVAIMPEVSFPTSTFLNAHFSPIGLRVGKSVGGFIEFGYGYKGVLNAGISVRL